MYKAHELIEKIMLDKEKHVMLLDMLKDLAKHIEIFNHNEYVELQMKLYDIAHGEHFTEELATCAVEHMQNVDGTHGQHWTMEQTNEVAKKHGFNGCFADFYYLMNMFYSDYSHVLGADTDTYAKMSMAYINDPDGQKGRAVKAYLSKAFN